MTGDEIPISIDVGGRSLIGILHRPDGQAHRRGVVIVVGGPQYRVGSHRQFVLLARALARQQFAVLRFDYSGMGDSDGAHANFELIDADVAAAIARLRLEIPEVAEVALWGLCDGATASLMYAHRDSRVTGLVLVNPWVRTEAGLAQAHFKVYYARRLWSRDFWSKIVRDPRTLAKAARDLLRNLRKAGARGERAGSSRGACFLDRTLEGAEAFRGDIAILLSGNDLVATEFKLLQRASSRWARALPPSFVRELPGANHTFSSAAWRGWVEARTIAFLRREPDPDALETAES